MKYKSSIIRLINSVLIGFVSFNSVAQSLLIASGSGGNYSVNYPANLAGSVPAGMLVVFKANHSVLGVGATLDMNGTGAVAIKKQFDQNFAIGDIAANQFVSVIYDNTNNVWQMLSVQATPPSGVNHWTVNGSNC